MVRTLYLLLLSCVLLLVACEDESPPSDEQAPRPAPTASAPSGVDDNPSDAQTGRILVLGNSLAAGYGLDSPDQAFPALLQQKIDSLGWDFDVVNAGVSGETTAGGRSRIGWLLRRPIDVLILELGGNDGLRGLDLKTTRQNLQAIIDTTRARYPEARILLAGMQIPPNLGPDYTERFKNLYPELAAANDVTLVPFLLEGVGGVRRLNQEDGIHPTAEGQRVVAQNVWTYLKPVLLELREEQLADAADCASDDQAVWSDTSALKSLDDYAQASTDAADCAE